MMKGRLTVQSNTLSIFPKSGFEEMYESLIVGY